MSPRGNTEVFEAGRALALTQSAVTRFSREIPVGEPWYRLLMVFNHAVTIGTGAGPLTQGGLRIVRGITLRTDRGEIIADSVPARYLYNNDRIKSGAPADLDATAAASTTQRANVNLWLADPLMLNPEDLLLDTARYNAVTLEILLGGIADLFSTVGTASVISTLDLYIERLKGRLPELPLGKEILFHQHYGVKPPVVPSTVQEVVLERAADLAYKRVTAFASGGASVVAGIPFSGDADSPTLDDISLEDGGSTFPFNRVLGRVLRSQNKQDYAQEAAVAGLLDMDVMLDGSRASALYSGDLSRLSVTWRNGTLPATPQVSVAYDAFKPLR